MKSSLLEIFGKNPLGLANRARDARDWVKAEKYYRLALKRRNRQRPAILIQHGHALKESGRLVEAEAAYRQSIELSGAVADSHLQLGHVLKLQGRIDEAVSSYLCALLLGAGLPEAKAELIGLGWTNNDVDRASLPNSIVIMTEKQGVFYIANLRARVEALEVETRMVARRFNAAIAALQDREAVLNRLRRIEELLADVVPPAGSESTRTAAASQKRRTDGGHAISAESGVPPLSPTNGRRLPGNDAR